MKTHTKAQIPYVQEELIEEILSRLPVKTLMRFKTVSRSWNNLIAETRFWKSHLKQSVIDHNRIKIMNFHDCHTTLAYDATTGRPVDADEAYHDVCFLAYCNGLFCISIAQDVFLWNPSTKQTRRISNSEIQFPTRSCTWASVFFGLGYHSGSDDYKLVRISMFDGIYFQTEVKVYSRNSDTWRRIQDFPYEFPFGCPGVYVNGCLHWIVQMWDDVRHHKVAVLDLADESYGLIPLPKFRCRDLYFQIGSLDEKLVVFYSCNHYTSDIWFLKEHDRAESWTRIKITTDCVGSFEALFYFQPLCVFKPGKILLRLGPKKIVSFDVEEKLLSDIYSPLMLDCRIVSFVETLVSPNATSP